MMDAVMISIRPEWCAKIANGEKTIEVRKTKPKLQPPFKCYIYCTMSRPHLVLGDVFRGNWETEYTTTYGYSREEADRIWGTMNGKVIGEFVCDAVFPIHVFDNNSIRNWNFYNLADACIPYDDLAAYIGPNKTGFGWHISNLKIYGVYDELKSLEDFWTEANQTFDYPPLTKLKRPPQSWCYVKENTDE